MNLRLNIDTSLQRMSANVVLQGLIPGMELAIQALQAQLEDIKTILTSAVVVEKAVPAAKRISANGRANIAQAQKRRWAKVREEAANKNPSATGPAKWWAAATAAQKKKRLAKMASGKKKAA